MKIVFRGATIWRLKPAFALGQVENKEENGWRNIFAEGKLCWENPSEWNPKILARLNRHFCFITRHISFQSFRLFLQILHFFPFLVSFMVLSWFDNIALALIQVVSKFLQMTGLTHRQLGFITASKVSLSRDKIVFTLVPLHKFKLPIQAFLYFETG